jgi:hypothetical protein
LYAVKQEERVTIEQIMTSLKQNNNGTLTLSHAGIEFRIAIPKNDFEYTFVQKEEWLYKRKDRDIKHKLIHHLGGGHCGVGPFKY